MRSRTIEIELDGMSDRSGRLSSGLLPVHNKDTDIFSASIHDIAIAL